MKDWITSTLVGLGMYVSIGVTAFLVPRPFGMLVAGVFSGLWACVYYYEKAPTAGEKS